MAKPKSRVSGRGEWAPTGIGARIGGAYLTARLMRVYRCACVRRATETAHAGVCARYGVRIPYGLSARTLARLFFRSIRPYPRILVEVCVPGSLCEGSQNPLRLNSGARAGSTPWRR
jgi:hypothetical protein